MPLSPKTASIGAAIIFSLALIVVAYLLSSPSGALQRVGAQSSEEILRAYAKKDADDDGLYDWQESLYGTDPLNPESVVAGKTDAAAVAEGLVAPKYVSESPKHEMPSHEELDETLGPAPAEGSLTEQFSREFLQAYLSGGGDQVLDQGAQDAFVQELLADFGSRAAQELGSSYTLTSVRQSTTLSVADYAAELEEVVRDHTLSQETADPIQAMDAYLVKGDASARVNILMLGETYARIRAGLLAMEAPSSLAATHLKLIRAYDTLTLSMDAIAHYNDDPLAVMGVLAVYPDVARGVLEAGAQVGKALVDEAGIPSEGAPGSLFVNVMYFMESL